MTHHHSSDAHAPADAPELAGETEQLVAGTLALMTTFYRMPHPKVCCRLLEHLGRLQQNPNFSEPFRAACAGLAAHWREHLVHATRALHERAGNGDPGQPTGLVH
ncbi:MAG TPA: hypothetical protein VM491_19845 [Burkholderiaceae bacterium]|jgi:hypothetical protein|nr:hypothetical protein [Burkholderiaceae bacterium]